MRSEMNSQNEWEKERIPFSVFIRGSSFFFRVFASYIFEWKRKLFELTRHGKLLVPLVVSASPRKRASEKVKLKSRRKGETENELKAEESE